MLDRKRVLEFDGSYPVDIIFKSLHDSSKQNIPPSRWKHEGSLFFDFLPPECSNMTAPLMSKQTMTNHQQIVQNWYSDKIDTEVLSDPNQIVNYAIDAATLRGVFC